MVVLFFPGFHFKISLSRQKISFYTFIEVCILTFAIIKQPAMFLILIFCQKLQRQQVFLCSS